jgi:hypothetical protein
MKLTCLPLLLCLLTATAVADASRPAGGDPARPSNEGWAFKLTPSYYATTNQPDATDINLRANHGPHALWVGYYRRGNEFEQTRTGYEGTLESDYGKLVPSLQLATHGFVGGAVNAEIGQKIYALVGYGRTNARDYYNLNFDPNDSATWGFGTQLLPDTNLALYTTRDIRLHTEQTVTHAVARYQPAPLWRLTLDVFTKRGRESADAPTKVSGGGVAVTCDYRDVFVRIARDNKVNYSAEDQTRFSLGFRF